MRKSINSATQKFEDQITEDLVLDAVPTVNSFNGVTSDGVARAIAGASGEVPQVTENDNGKVLKAIYDEGGPAVEWGEGVTVDQTYDATSANAQSGVAVAQAIASASGNPDEWWGGDPGEFDLSGYGKVRILFKNTGYDPRNDSDTSFLNRFSDITKNDDGSYDFTFKKPTSGTEYAYAAFNGKYTGDNEFVILAWETKFDGSYGSWAYTFEGCTGLRAVYNMTSGSKAYDFTRTFYGCTNLVVCRDIPSAYRSSIKVGISMFEGCTSLRLADMTVGQIAFNTNAQGNYQSMFKGCSSLESGPLVIGNPASTNAMFLSCTSLRSFKKPEGGADYTGTASQVAYDCDCAYMFASCGALEDVSSLTPLFRMMYVKNGASMFSGCGNLRVVPPLTLSASGTPCNDMFNRCRLMTALPDIVDYSPVTDANSMFEDCRCLCDITPLASVTWNADLANVSEMFYNCYTLQKGLKAVYDSMAATATITSHDRTFSQCGRVYGNPERAQIPSSWGGTGA